MKEHYCSKCGHPEPSAYVPAINVTYTCSRCVQKMLMIDESKSEEIARLAKRNDRANKIEIKLGGDIN